ncbi:MAG: putative baseplate assembly protein [Gammaproteobacteria bacterium]|jgi:hypothetical protein
MPIPHYKLDDRNFEDLVAELLSRIPGHTPEWTNPRVGDPGRTMVELFAWLADTILYRANLIPERQRLVFLRLLNIPMQPAIPASGLVALEMANEKLTKPIQVPVYTTLKGPVDFETRSEINVLPLKGQVYAKRKPTKAEVNSLKDVVMGLESVYNIKSSHPYIATPVYKENKAQKAGFDFVGNTVDKAVWIALLVARKEDLASVKDSLSRAAGGTKLINIGMVPQLQVPELFAKIGKQVAADQVWRWEITTPRLTSEGLPDYSTMDVVLDTTQGFSQQGIVRLELPDSDDIGVPENDVAVEVNAGVGDRPPRIDDSDVADRLLAWIRLTPQHKTNSLALTWVGVNAINIDQRKTLNNVVVTTSNGAADQMVNLPGTSVESETLKIQVEEIGKGYVDWSDIGDIALAQRDDRVFQLDAEAGTIRFGDGVRGRVPQTGMRVRIVTMRAGGGSKGNLAANNLTAISHPNLKAVQPVATSGGEDAETLDEAEKRIPAFLKHGDRAVTEQDYKRLAADTPAVEVGRVEVLPKFKPQQRREGVPGVVTVMVLPKSTSRAAPNPRPDRIMLERVHAFLDQRRPLAVELYVIGVEYVDLGLAVAVGLRDGHSRDQVLQNIRDALKDYLWPLTPGGHDGEGWALGQSVINQELEVVVARVKGVRKVTGINMFVKNIQNWVLANTDPETGAQKVELEPWQLPELLSIVVVEDEDSVPTELKAEPAAPDDAVAIPVIPEVC